MGAATWRERWPTWLLSGLAAALVVNRVAPEFLDADTVLMALMSTQKVTLFYWGQDRYANVLPALLSWLPDLQANLMLHMWLHALAFFLLLERVTDLTLASAPRLHRLWLWTVLVALTCVLWRPFALYQFVCAAQPYALSLVLAIDSARFWPRQRLVSLLLLVAALGLNPALLLLVLGSALLWPRPVLWLGLAVLVAAGWLLAGWLAPFHSPASYAAFDWRGLPDVLATSVADLRNNALRPRYVVSALVVAVLAGWPMVHPLRRALAGILGAGLAWWLLFLGNRWVQDNHVAFRYFLPLLIAPVLVAGISVALGVLQRWPRCVRFAAPILGVVVVGFLLRPLVPLQDYAVWGPARAPLQTVQARDIHYVAGDYWVAWPMVFLAQTQGYQLDGAFSRGIALQPEIQGSIRARQSAGRQVRAMCVHKGVPTCQEQLQKVTGQPWRVLDVVQPGEAVVLGP